MEEGMNLFYDKEGDVLDLSIGDPRDAISEEVSEDFFIRKDPKTKEILGFMVLNFEKRFQKLGQTQTLPLKAHFQLTP